jgi:hypothetical protein
VKFEGIVCKLKTADSFVEVVAIWEDEAHVLEAEPGEELEDDADVMFEDEPRGGEDEPWGDGKRRTTSAIVATARTMMTATTNMVVPTPRRGSVIPTRRLRL